MGKHDGFKSQPTEAIRCPKVFKPWAKDLLRMVDENPRRIVKIDELLRNSMNVHLLLIDPQNDFCDFPQSALPVLGGDQAMHNVAQMIKAKGHKLEDIHVTLDSHRMIDIAHPAWWMDANGNSPAPMTLISLKDIQDGIWSPRNPAFRDRTLAYAKELEANSSYQICVWPPHCLIGTWGHNVHPEINEALQEWSKKEFAMVDYVTKGSNPWTEHYGALMAEVPDASDPGTSLNTQLLQILSEADIVAVAGLAESHCVLATVKQIAENIGQEHVKKFHILQDCTAPVPAIPNGPDFPAIAKQFFLDMQQKGMTLTNSVDFLA
jgi:nicotinamidase/pyrazinamidase